MDEMGVELESVGVLAAEDQVLAGARTAARALAAFWQNLPEDIPEDLRQVLTVRWQESQSRWQSIDSDEEWWDE